MQYIPLLTAGFSIGRQTAAFAVESLKAIRDPTDADAVSAVGELSSLHALESMKSAMMADKQGRSILRHKPLVEDGVLEFSRTLPATSFGRQYAAYMDHNHFTPSGRTPVRHIADPTLAYVMTRYRQCHDFLHAITGCGRSVEEELALKVLEWRHTGLPLGLLAVAGGWPHLSAAQRSHMRVYSEWAQDNSPCSVHGQRQVQMYLTVPWEEMLSKDVEEVVALTGITPLPTYMAKRNAVQ